jgi:hypothetical protein
MRVCVVTFLALIAATPVLASSMPNLDVAKTCREERSANIAIGGKASGESTSQADIKKSYDQCMSSELNARKRASGTWPRIKEVDRSRCASLAGSIYPSYSELSACLDMYDPRAPGESANLDKPATPKVRQPHR